MSFSASMMLQEESIENIVEVILNTPAIVMLGFTQEEIERTYEKTQRA